MSMEEKQSIQKKNPVAAVVVTYNRKELLKECIAALLSQQGSSCDVLIIDNASTDGTGEMVQQLIAEHDAADMADMTDTAAAAAAGGTAAGSALHYINTGANLGGAGGFHYGICRAMEAGYDWIWMMDDDTVPKTDALAALVEADRLAGGPGQYGYLSSVVEWIDGKQCEMNCQKYDKHFYKRIDLLEYGMFLLDQATFVSLFLPAETVRRVGLPIKEYFIWGDDIEYTRRIGIRCGMPSFLVGKSHVVHKMANNNGSHIATDDISRLSRYNYAYRNDGSTYMREGFHGFAYFSAKCALNFFKCIGQAKDHRLRRCWIVLRGYFRGLFYRPAVEKWQDN